MLTIGLTGGIASGKSIATDFFQRHDVPVIDADHIVHELIHSGNNTFDQIIAHFGKSVLGQDGEINRSKLRNLIFSDDEQRKVLEAIIHPVVRIKITEQLEQLDHVYCIVCIPLLIETGQQDLFDRILVIDVDQSTQIERIQNRDNISPSLIKNILAAQTTQQVRNSAADDVILNNSSLSVFEENLAQLHNKYLQLSEKLANS